MEQNLKKSGWNLNPMFYWKYVMNKTSKTVPEIRFIDYPLDEVKLIKLAYENPTLNFTVETEENPGGLLVSQNNVKYVWRKILNSEERLKALSNTDYAVCKNDNPRGLEAGLCGIKLFTSFEELKENITKLKVLNSVERIENWENTKNRLTKD